MPMNDEIMRGVGLPWKARDNELLFDDGCIVGQFFSVDSGADGGFDAKRCAYAAKAANLFPKLIEALSLILPMAKGYAHAHNVGNNWQFVEQAEATLAATTKKPEEPK